MERRDFIKYTAFAGLGLASSKLYALNSSTTQSNENQLFCTRNGALLPVIYDVDILYIGGSTAAIASAIAASNEGVKTCIISPEPYLGEDICGTLRFWDINKETQHPFTKKLLLNGELPSPLHIKKVLDGVLVDNDIPFLFSSYVSNIFYDKNKTLAGIAISNRSGEQIIRTKIVVDATPYATLCRQAQLSMTKPKDSKREFLFTVLGNSTIKDIPNKVHSETIKTLTGEYAATEYSIQIEDIKHTIADYAKAENMIRGMVWDANQVDSADLLFEIPKTSIFTKLQTLDKTPIQTLSIDCFASKENERIYALNGYIGIELNRKKDFLKPENYIINGERLGTELAKRAKNLTKVAISGNNSNNSKVLDNQKASIYLEEMRETHNLEQLSIENEVLPIFGTYETIVSGGGTAGAPAGIGAARYGSKTLVLEYLHTLGGIGTAGLIGRYWHGYRKGFTSEIDREVKRMAPDDHLRQIKNRPDDWVIEWKAEWYRKEIIKARGDIWFGAIVCGALTEGTIIRGIVVATPYGKGVVLGKKVIDSTGSADVAIAAGSKFEYVDGNSVAVQGSGLPSFNPGNNYRNTDWTFTHDSDVFDITQTFVSGRTKYNDIYDVGKLPQTRERRRIIGDFKITALDMINDRKYPDVISVHVSSFDSHGYTIDPYFTIKPPAGSSVDMYAKVPLRSLLPQGLENIIVTGLGACAHRDAMPVIRMQPCLQNQGYSVGILTAMAIKEDKTYREFDIKKLQQELIKIENLPAEALEWADTFPPTETQLKEALKELPNELNQLELILWDTPNGLSLIEDAYKISADKEIKLLYAYLLAFYNIPLGWKDLVDKINSYNKWDEGWNYTGMGQFGYSSSYLDGLIMALGNTKKDDALDCIHRMASKLTSSSHLSHYRAIAYALQTIGSITSASILADILRMPGVSGYAATNLKEAIFFTNPGVTDTSTRNLNLRELFIAKALYLCGDQNNLAYNILKDYSNDLRGHYAIHAREVLKLNSAI